MPRKELNALSGPLWQQILILKHKVAQLASGGFGAHASSHEDGGSDPIDVTDLDGYPGGTTTFLRADGTFATPSVGGLGDLLDYQFVRKTGDESVTNSTVLQDDDHLLFAIGASETWIFRLVIVYTAAADATNGKLKVAFTVPASATVQWSTMGKNGAETTNSGGFATNTGQTSGTNAGNHGGAGATLMHLVIDGIVVNSTNAGNVTLQWAQNAVSATATVLKTNSFLKAERVA